MSDSGMLLVGYGFAALLYGGYYVHLVTRRRALARAIARRQGS